ncbi:hypothetical protein [Ferrimonas marina]|uniref:Zinc resistance-associated protein n=1 Tax=Ferrimonas marina TaxID=299255 RepID=A0A1M5VHK1_9GAMM|nr:hypothetical protein [Ferrimonas marina]SHH74658.1 hypothetical protein SAMN02745129_2781 [Ferrimonas marina]
MKTTWIALLLGAVISLGVQAGHHGGGHAKMQEMLKQELQLSEAQGQQFDQLYQDLRQQWQSIKQSDVSQEEKKAQMQAARESHQQALRALLNDDQWQRYETLRDAHHGKGYHKKHKDKYDTKA